MTENNTEASAYVSSLHAFLNEHADPANALAMSKYMKDHFPFFGIKSPERKSLFSEFSRSHFIPDDWKEVILLCWHHGEREMQYVAMDMVYKMKRKLQRNDLNFIEKLIVNKSWWDTVDFLASNIAGHFFFMFPDLINPVTDKWRHSGNMWLVRTCILFQLKYRDYTDFKLLQSLIHENKYSNEFFIQKAIGWSLRQYAKYYPKEVRAFVAETELKKLSRREALKHFS